MADTVQTLLNEIKGVVDVTDAEALTALNRRHRKMVARARSYRDIVALGPTVVGQAFYGVTGVIELYGVEVNGVPYGKARRPDVYAYSQGALTWSGDGGLIVSDVDASSVLGLTFIPAPDTAGLAISGRAAIVPPDLLQADTAAALKVDSDFYDALVEGATATVLARIGEGDPDRLEARFDASCEELRRRVARRFRGPGPTQIRVAGINA